MDGLALIVGLIALVLAFLAGRRLTAVEVRLAALAQELRVLRATSGLSPGPQAPEPSQAPALPAAVPPLAAEPGAIPGTEPEAAREQAAEEAPQAAAAAPAQGADTSHAGVPPPAAAAPAPTLEERLGTRWAVWVGGAALALGGVLLVRFSIEQGVFGPGVRVALGCVFALALIAAGEWFRRSERASVIEAIPAAHVPGILTAAGTASLFGTVYAAYGLYHFIGPAAAFVLLGAIGVATMFAAALHGPALAGLGLAGALAVPLLIESHEPNPWPLVIYLAVVATAAYALARLRRWLWLAAAVVAGAFVWGLALTATAGEGSAPMWASALFVHAGLQLALAAAFMGLEPHLGTAEEAAEPDWIAGAALAALTVLAVLALDAAPSHGQWATFAAIAIAILTATAWRSAPAAAAAPLAGIVALAAIAIWPGLASPPEPRLLAPALEGVLRLPDNVSSFLTFAACSTLAVAAAAGLRLWRGRRLPALTAGLYALAAVVPPLLALVIAYLRVTQFDRSISFSLFAVALTGIFYFAAGRFHRIAPADATPATHLATGAIASGVAAAMSLAFVMVLDRGYLTVAFAVTAATTAVFAVTHRIPLLRYVVAAIGFIVLGRLAWDPRIMGDDVGTWPILNWLLLGYGAPALAFLAAGHILKREGEDLAVRLCDALGVLFAALLVYFQIRHALNGGDPLAPTSSHIEQGLFALTSLGFAAVLIRIDRARANPIFRAASLIFGVVSALIILIGLGLFENPLFSNDRVLGPVVFSSLLIAYLLPGLAAVALTRLARGVRPVWYVTGVAALAVLLVFGYVTLEVRHAFQGDRIGFLRSTSAPEIWSYSVAWLALGLIFLGYGLLRHSKEARLASAALVVLSVIKVFLYDLTGIGGFWRAFSVICLGAVLIGIGLVYQKLIFARPQTPAASPPVN